MYPSTERLRKVVTKRGDKMLVLEPKPNEQIVLFDAVSKARVIIQSFYRDRDGSLALAFDAPRQIRVTREPRNEQRNARNGNAGTD